MEIAFLHWPQFTEPNGTCHNDLFYYFESGMCCAVVAPSPCHAFYSPELRLWWSELSHLYWLYRLLRICNMGIHKTPAAVWFQWYK